ncbi:hypothetical protein VTJ49DRAFT_2071 [Mycothermus thermophilus]|uniref:Palmitoyltransferase n=1 Tax=Humicola insolens TaxID=85995 RepID=A0ABR3VBN3_HUMIN
MGTLTTIAIIVLSISFVVFVAFFGRLPALRRTPIAWLHRLLCVRLPNAINRLDDRLTGGRVIGSCVRFGNFIMYDRHPTVLIFYILLLSIGEYLYLPAAWPRLSTFHKTTGTLTILLPYLFLYLAASTDPGTITPANHPHEMARYPYDFTLFHPGIACPTCRHLKPARSKHCSVCKRCVARCDHHCIFINNCVGAANHHYFLLLLASTATLTAYGGYLGVQLMTTAMRQRFPHWAILWWRARDGQGMGLGEWLTAWSWGMQDGGLGTGGGVAMGAVTLLAVMTTPLVGALLGYHVWLVYCGTTTNESMKWADWQVEMDEGCAFKRRLDGQRQKDANVEPLWTRWPVEAEQVLVRTRDGNPPAGDAELPGEGEWEKVWRVRELENLYDLGFWDNLVDVFVPGYMFRDPDVPVVEERRRKRKKRRARRTYLG